MPEPHERLDRAMNRRRLDLRMNWVEVAKAADISYAALRAIRRGDYRPTELTARGIDQALEWEPGSTVAILAGGEPTPLAQPESPVTDPRDLQIAAIADLLASLPPEMQAEVLRRYEGRRQSKEAETEPRRDSA